VSSARYDLGFYIPEDGILHSNRRENFKSYIEVTCLRLVCNVSDESDKTSKGMLLWAITRYCIIFREMRKSVSRETAQERRGFDHA
jgi:hypothetical protein